MVKSPQPRLGISAPLGTPGPVLDGQNPGAGPSNHRSTGICLPAMVQAPKVPPVLRRSMGQPVVLSIPRLSQVPSLLFYLGLGGAPSGEGFFLQW